MRLIDADALKTTYFYPKNTTNAPVLSFISLEAINNAPSIEAEPVLHARWEEYTKISWYNIHCYRGCSQCGYARNDDNPDNDTSYCPNCGAKMDGGGDDG